MTTTTSTGTATATGAQRIGYKRVSTTDQNTLRQLDGLELDRVFEDHASGSTTLRPGLQSCLAHLRPGDTLIVHSLDRLGRSLADLDRLVNEVTARGVRVEFVTERLAFTQERDPFASLTLHLLGAFAQFERALIRARQAEGIRMAKAQGKYKGGKPKLSADQAAEMCRRDRENSGKGRSALARQFGVSRETLYQYLRAG